MEDLEYSGRMAIRNHLYVYAKASEDLKQWSEVQIYDISSGGLKFESDINFDIGDILWFDLLIKSVRRKWTLKVKAEILGSDNPKDKIYIYRARFKDISKTDKMELDIFVTHSLNNIGDTIPSL